MSCTSKISGSIAAVLVAALMPVNAACADPAPADVEALTAELKSLKQEQESTNKRIEALEQRILQLEGDGTLDPQARLSDTDTALMRGRGLGGAPDAQPPSQPATAAGEDESRKEPAKSAAVEAVTRNEQGYFGRAFAIEPGISYSHFSNAQLNLNGFLALDAIFLGLISIDQTNADVITSDVTARYGFGRFQADVNVPYLYRRSNFRSGGAGGNASGLIERTITSRGLGDVSAGLSYRVLKETASLPDVVVNVRGKAPTGRDPFGVELIEVPGSQGNLKI